MLDLALFAYCAAIGFAAAGAVSSLYQLLTAEAADFTVHRSGVAGNVVAVLVSMFGGPAIIARKVVVGWRSRELTALPAAVGFTVAGVWSTCAGVFFVSLLAAA